MHLSNICLARARRNEVPQAELRNAGDAINLWCGNLIKLREDNSSNLTLVNGKLIHIIADPYVLRLAYEFIKSKPGNMTPGVTPETLDSISLEYLQALSSDIKAGRFRFTPARRIWIPKPGKDEKRPLAIASPREKIVQKAMELVLSSIYEPCFTDNSHGFRPNRSTHTALRMIDTQCRGAAWFIEADISKCFDTISHDHLMTIIYQRVSCQKTLALIRSALKAGYIELGGINEKALMGTPQGSVLSPLLCNIFLHKLDIFMLDLIRSHDKGSRRRQNPAYSRFLNRLAKHPDEREPLRKQLRTVPSRDPFDPNFVRVRYVRYADDFLISVLGSHELAVSIKEKVATFLQDDLHLTLNEAKTSITNSRHAAFFLGTEITWRHTPEKLVVTTSAGKKSRVTGRMSLHAPIAKLIARLQAKGFIKWGVNRTQTVPTGVRWLQNQDHADILRYYNAVVRGILNYYSFADNRSSLGSVVRLLQMSCARTLALKYKLRFMSKAFRRFGRTLACPDTDVEFYLPDSLSRTRKFNVSEAPSLAMLHRTWSNKLTRSNLGKPCIICGATPSQMHHIRKLRDLKTRSHLTWFSMQMAAINRKQIPLCQDHHMKLHNNQLSPMERAQFQSGVRDLTSK
jgi:group II intron reverse transcriptase/maturase